MTSRLERESHFHDTSYKEQLRAGLDKYYALTRSSHMYYRQLVLANAYDKQVLEYGCGLGSYALEIAKHGGHVTGIDLSEIAISLAKDASAQAGLAINFRVMNGEDLLFDDNSFDLICGTGILHHLQLDRAFSEIIRVLKPNGKAIFLEPLGHNLLINIYRRFTPHLRTPDEHPLRISDIRLARRFFQVVESRFFYLATLMAIPFVRFSFFPTLLRLLDKTDTFLFEKLPFIRRYAWIVLLVIYCFEKDRYRTDIDISHRSISASSP